jgi:hypothetical protein
VTKSGSACLLCSHCQTLLQAGPAAPAQKQARTSPAQQQQRQTAGVSAFGPTGCRARCMCQSSPPRQQVQQWCRRRPAPLRAARVAAAAAAAQGVMSHLAGGQASWQGSGSVCTSRGSARHQRLNQQQQQQQAATQSLPLGQTATWTAEQHCSACLASARCSTHQPGAHLCRGVSLPTCGVLCDW